MRRFEDVVLNQNGQPVPNAQVTVFLAGTSLPALLYSNDGQTLIGNPVTTNSLASGNPGLFSFFVASGKYDFQVSGPNIATYTQRNVQVEDIFEFQVTDTQPWQTQTLEFNSLTTGQTPPVGAVNLYSKLADKNLYYKDDTGREVGPLSGGAGGTPAAPFNAIQKNNLGVFGPALATDNGTTFAINEDSQFQGPNPWADIRAFGKFGAFSSTTANTTSGSATVTLASAQSFKNGEYVTLYNAGGACGLSAPGTPTVTPGVSSGALNSVAAPVGSSAFDYQIVAADKFGCYTPASLTGSTTTGNSLGMKTLTISTISRNNNVATVTTTTAHGLAVGQMVHLVYFSCSDSTFEGFWIVSGIVNPNVFTFVQGYDTRNGATTSATSGTLKVFNVNRITWTAVPGAWKYYIYGRTGGIFGLLGQSLTTSYVDFGSPMNDNQIFPSFIPTTAPATGANDHLTAKILSGGGSTALTLASVAGVSKTTIILSDDGPALVAAAQSAPAVYIPSVGLGVNSYTLLPGTKNFKMGGDIQATDTIENGSATTWESVAGGTGTSFASSTGRQLFGTAYPQMVLKVTNNFNRFQFNCTAPNGCLNTVDSMDAVHLGFDYTVFATGNGGLLDYIGMNQLFMGGGFNFRYNKCLFTTGVGGPNDPGNIGNTPVPSVLFTTRPADGNSTANAAVTASWFTNRGSMAFNYGLFGVSWVLLKDIQTQSISLPTIQFTGANLSGGLNAQDITVADRPTAFFANYSSIGWGSAFLENISASSGSRGSVTGLPFAGLAVHGVAVLGQNTGYVYLDGGIYTDGNVLASVAGTPMAIPTGVPTVVVGGGGSIPPGTWTFKVLYGDANGLLSSPTSPSTAVVISAGSQTVTITRPLTAPVGAVSWAPYASNGGGYARIPCPMQPMSSTSYVWPLSFTCGITVGLANGTASSISANGLLAPSLQLWSNGFTTATDFPSVLTVNQTLHVPNATGTLALKELAQTWTASQTFQGPIFSTGTVFGSLGTPANGAFVYCSDCTIASPCAGGGTGAFAKRLNSTWVCN